MIKTTSGVDYQENRTDLSRLVCYVVLLKRTDDLVNYEPDLNIDDIIHLCQRH